MTSVVIPVYIDGSVYSRRAINYSKRSTKLTPGEHILGVVSGLGRDINGYIDVSIGGTVEMETGGSIDMGDPLTVNNIGQAIQLTVWHRLSNIPRHTYVMGYALGDAKSAGEYVMVKLIG